MYKYVWIIHIHDTIHDPYITDLQSMNNKNVDAVEIIKEGANTVGCPYPRRRLRGHVNEIYIMKS